MQGKSGQESPHTDGELCQFEHCHPTQHRPIEFLEDWRPSTVLYGEQGPQVTSGKATLYPVHPPGNPYD